MSRLDSLLSRISKKSEGEAQIKLAVPFPLSEENNNDDDNDDLFSLVSIEEPFQEQLQSKNFPLPDRDLFTAIFTPYLKDPYWFASENFRIYKKWLLGDSCYVLNTFKGIDVQRLLELFLEGNPPTRVGALYPMAMFLWEVDLMVPESYQLEFERIIRDGWNRKPKNSA